MRGDIVTTYAAPAYDLRSLIESRAPTRLSYSHVRTDGGVYTGPCPFPDCSSKNDAFHCWPNSERPRYWCRVCGRHGDAISFIRQYEGKSYFDARRVLDIDTPATHSPAPTHMTQLTSPSKKWQERARGLCHIATQALYGKNGGPGLRYLARRGFSDATIQEAGYGLIPHDMYDDPGHWFDVGENKNAIKKVFIPAGVLIPFYHAGELWKISIRRKKPVSAKDRYYDLPGSSECLYGADTISSDSTTVLYEGCFDATSGQQVAPEFAHVATADVHKCRSARWIARLCLASRVLVAYDADEAGDRESHFWTRTLSHATRWRPWAKDVNAMLVQGPDILEWLVLGLA